MTRHTATTCSMHVPCTIVYSKVKYVISSESKAPFIARPYSHWCLLWAFIGACHLWTINLLHACMDIWCCACWNVIALGVILYDSLYTGLYLKYVFMESHDKFYQLDCFVRACRGYYESFIIITIWYMCIHCLFIM